MLSNINNERDQILQIILVGQPELLHMLQRPDLRQFAQRISVHCHLTPLSPAETAGYIRHRLSVVGGLPGLFNDTACAAVHFFTEGVPRLINLLCDQSLLYAFAEDEKTVNFRTVTEVVLDRNSTGLSSFKSVVKDQTEADLMLKLEGILKEIRQFCFC
jgi:type II secretory pathway predicted ATPase ExeA